MQKPRGLPDANACECHRQPLCNGDSYVISDLGVKNAMVCTRIKDRLNRRGFLVLIPDKNFECWTPDIIQLGAGSI